MLQRIHLPFANLHTPWLNCLAERKGDSVILNSITCQVQENWQLQFFPRFMMVLKRLLTLCWLNWNDWVFEYGNFLSDQSLEGLKKLGSKNAQNSQDRSPEKSRLVKQTLKIPSSVDAHLMFVMFSDFVAKENWGESDKISRKFHFLFQTVQEGAMVAKGESSFLRLQMQN